MVQCDLWNGRFRRVPLISERIYCRSLRDFPDGYQGDPELDVKSSACFTLAKDILPSILLFKFDTGRLFAIVDLRSPGAPTHIS